MTDKKIAYDSFCDQVSENGEARSEIVPNPDFNASLHGSKGPHNIHSFCKGFQMMKTNLHLFPVNFLDRRPPDGNPRSSRGHLHNVAVLGSLKEFYPPVMRENFRPQFKVRCNLEYSLTGSIDTDGVFGVHAAQLFGDFPGRASALPAMPASFRPRMFSFLRGRTEVRPTSGSPTSINRKNRSL